MLCSRCQTKGEESDLQPCPTCKKPFCEKCVHVMGGKAFCSRGCATYFFFGDGEDDGDLDEDS
ncbi:MAG: hypothetical protein ACE5IK_05310 [Acidobacteriota bacterium]